MGKIARVGLTSGKVKVQELPGELADVALYLLQLAYLSGIDLEQAILDKLSVNHARSWPDDEPSPTQS